MRTKLFGQAHLSLFGATNGPRSDSPADFGPRTNHGVIHQPLLEATYESYWERESALRCRLTVLGTEHRLLAQRTNQGAIHHWTSVHKRITGAQTRTSVQGSKPTRTGSPVTLRSDERTTERFTIGLRTTNESRKRKLALRCKFAVPGRAHQSLRCQTSCGSA